MSLAPFRAMVFGVTKPMSDDLSTVQWPRHFYPGAGVIAEIMSRLILYGT